ELAHEEVSAAGEELTDTFSSELVSRNAFRGAPRHHSRHDAFDAQCPEMHERALERKGFAAL
ncbi:hypothetical protein, partial [Pseudomonas savastanoi]|uniref:hypothetical protein n=1 Tax=Pseudomonas savastanoi TaxID=29438 RepID=UPI001C807AF1